MEFYGQINLHLINTKFLCERYICLDFIKWNPLVEEVIYLWTYWLVNRWLSICKGKHDLRLLIPHRHAYTFDVDNFCLTHGGNVSYFPSVELIEYIHCTGFIETNSIFSVRFSFDLFAIIHSIASNLLLCVLSNIFKFRPKQFPKCFKKIICFLIK